MRVISFLQERRCLVEYRLKVEQQLSKVEGLEVNEVSEDDDNIKAFDFLIERKNGEVKLAIEEHKKGTKKRKCGRRK